MSPMSRAPIERLSVLLAATVLLTGCGSSFPACSGSDVEAVVFDVVREQVGLARYEQITRQTRVFPLPDGFKLDHAINDPSDEYARKNGLAAQEFAAQIALDLSGTRTNETNEASRSTACAATLTVNDNTLEITYNAQYSEDGMVYVEVFGL